MTIGFGNIAEPDCSVSAEKVVHPLMREEGLILLSSLLSKERTSGNIARSPTLRLTSPLVKKFRLWAALGSGGCPLQVAF